MVIMLFSLSDTIGVKSSAHFLLRWLCWRYIWFICIIVDIICIDFILSFINITDSKFLFYTKKTFLLIAKKIAKKKSLSLSIF